MCVCLSADVQSAVLKSADAVIHLNSVETGFFFNLILKQSNAQSFTTLDLGTCRAGIISGISFL